MQASAPSKQRPSFPLPQKVLLLPLGLLLLFRLLHDLELVIAKSLAVVPPTIYSCFYNSYMIVECKLPRSVTACSF
jgi:hypothetical protein